jgi:hypothetical protein
MCVVYVGISLSASNRFEVHIFTVTKLIINDGRMRSEDTNVLESPQF